MASIIIMSLILIVFLYWEYNLSRSVKLFKALQKKEPETYNLLCKDKFLYPSLTIKGIIANNQYNEIKTDALRQELLDIDKKQSKYPLIIMCVFVIYLLINLLN